MELSAEQVEQKRLQAKLTKRFHKACADYGLIADGDHILVGLSGGKDSLALVELLGKRAQIYVPRFRVTALHVRVRERAYLSDTSALELFCRSFGVPLIVKDTEIGESPATAERATEKDPCFLCAWYRRKVLFDTAQELGCNKIALGHHKDDIVETLLMNLLFQGAFATMPPCLPMEKMPLRLVRPLCLIEEEDLMRYAELRAYPKQTRLCPFEKASSRAEVKQLLRRLEQLNPNVRDSLWGAMENVKAEYLPRKIMNYEL
ncbi:MAG: tRNA 2-thiocytidine biosynthesis TtcA family protein [Paludibacteraceae bacterium]